MSCLNWKGKAIVTYNLWVVMHKTSLPTVFIPFIIDCELFYPYCNSLLKTASPCTFRDCYLELNVFMNKKQFICVISWSFWSNASRLCIVYTSLMKKLISLLKKRSCYIQSTYCYAQLLVRVITLFNPTAVKTASSFARFFLGFFQLK